MVNPSAKTCVTVAGKGSPGATEDGGFEHAQFSEPGGLCLDAEGKLLVVADTNNHAIRVLDLEKERVSKVRGAIVTPACYSELQVPSC